MSLRRVSRPPPKPRTFREGYLNAWKRGEFKKARPVSIKVIEDIYGRVVPLGSDPDIDEDSKPYVVAMPDNIPDSWKPTADTPAEYQKAMDKYQNEIAKRIEDNADRQQYEGKIQDSEETYQAMKDGSKKGFGKQKKRPSSRGRVTRRVGPY